MDFNLASSVNIYKLNDFTAFLFFFNKKNVLKSNVCAIIELELELVEILVFKEENKEALYKYIIKLALINYLYLKYYIIEIT
jgi:hypothetical protein